MTERFKLVNKSRINNNRVRLIKSGTSTANLDPLFGAIYENEQEIGVCLSPYTVISCVGAKVESEIIEIDGGGWSVEVDGVAYDVDKLDFDSMVTFIESKGVRVTEQLGAYSSELICDGALGSESLLMDDGQWMLEVDGINMGGPYTLAELDEQSRRREVRITVPEPITCDPSAAAVFSFTWMQRYAVDKIVDGLTGEVLLTQNTIINNSNASTEKVNWLFDDNYNYGAIRNLTDECLLLKFIMSSTEPATEIVEWDSDVPNGVIRLDDEGVLYVSLAPYMYNQPTVYVDVVVENQPGIKTSLGGNNLADTSNGNVYLAVNVAVEKLPPEGFHIECFGQEYVISEPYVAHYYKAERIARNDDLGAKAYVLRNDLTTQDDAIISFTGLYEYDVVQRGRRWVEYTGTYNLTVSSDAGSFEYRGDGESVYRNVLESESVRVKVSRDTPVTFQFNPLYAGAYIMDRNDFTDDYSNKLGVVDSTGKVEVIFSSARYTTESGPNVRLYDPNIIDELPIPYYKTNGFVEIRDLYFQ